MSLYPVDDEEKYHAQNNVREWTLSGLLTPEQGARLERETVPGWRRAPGFLRGVLVIFAWGVLAATLWLTHDMFHLKYDVAPFWWIWALVSYGLAEYLIWRGRLYRHGIEEALVTAAVVLLYAAVVASLKARSWIGDEWNYRQVAVLLATAAACGAAYRRFGYIYLGLAAPFVLLFIPGYTPMSPLERRVSIAVLFIFLGGIARWARAKHKGAYSDQEFSVFQAAFALGVYLALNLRMAGWGRSLDPRILLNFPQWFYWTTYVLAWFLPAVFITAAIREKDRALLDIGLVTAVLTFITNKPYLGWPRREWDPMLLGLVLVGVAVAVRRWLAKAPEKRAGWTAEKLLNSDKRLMTALSVASAAWHPFPGGAASHGKTDLGGGRSGGAGASDKW